MLRVVLSILAAGVVAAPMREESRPWKLGVSGIIDSAIENQLIPGVTLVAGVACRRQNASVQEEPADTIRATLSAGHHTYEPTSGEMTLDTAFDLASLTKVTLCTTSFALLYQWGHTPPLTTRVASAGLLGAAFGARGKDAITLEQLLTHTAGFPPDPVPGYLEPAFGCPESSNYYPRQAFTCVERIFDALCANQSLANVPGQRYVYSDLSMITLMFVVGRLVKSNRELLLPDGLEDPACQDPQLSTCFYMSFVRRHVLSSFGLSPSAGYLPENAIGIPPEWDDPLLRHRWVVGFVSDENAYAMGGVSGHAGFFASVLDLVRIVNVWAWPSEVRGRLNATTVARFTTVVNASKSSRALGWDTHTVSCGTMTKYDTFTHTGFTGTQICVDPTMGIFSITLSNAKFANKASHAMIHLRPKINTAIVAAVQTQLAPDSEPASDHTAVAMLVAVALVVALITAVALYSYLRRVRASAPATTLQARLDSDDQELAPRSANTDDVEAVQA